MAWDACLKKTEVNLEFLNDVDMLLMIEKGIRGGVSTITKRHAEANNPYMKTYDSILRISILPISMQIIFMVGQCHNHFQPMDLSGCLKKS